MKEIIINGEEFDYRRIASAISQAEPYSVLRFTGKFELSAAQSGKMLIGRDVNAHLFDIDVPYVTFDGSGAVFNICVTDLTNSFSLFFVNKRARCAKFRNMNINVVFRGASTEKFVASIYNTTYGVSVENCKITMRAENAVRMVGVFNNGNLDTHMDTRADNLILSGNRIDIRSTAQDFDREIVCTGLHNELANSVCVTNNYFFVQVAGAGEMQRAVGVYNDGRFMRLCNNNIKANGTHNKGMELEQAFAVAVLNRGLYTLISDNNIVAEWAGTAVALWNQSSYCKTSGNKILATHTVKGRSVRNYGSNSIFCGNILTSTSRNARLIESFADNVIISDNFMQVLLGASDAKSGTGVFAKDCKNVCVRGNIILDTLNCGIYGDNAAFVQSDNVCEYINVPSYIANATAENVGIRFALDERNIHSIHMENQN